MLYARVPAHPRVGGENTKTRMSPGLTVGSSPRGRGKHFALIDVLFEERLIPAWAGKTILSPGLNCAHRAHPRVGGENGQGDGLSAVARGSSPRGRGKLVVVVLGVVEFRLIPAWAGKTTSSTPKPETIKGSSPRGRGKPRSGTHRFVRPRLIPAWAGKTSALAHTTPRARAHPRVGGENAGADDESAALGGSSPRGRGKRGDEKNSADASGLIPAWAGKTLRGLPIVAICRAHPRVGGENRYPRIKGDRAGGSSPRGRGKRTHCAREVPSLRLIPAWAGKTRCPSI